MQNGGSARGYQELSASLAAGQTRLQSRRSGRQGRMFIHRRSYRERTHLVDMPVIVRYQDRGALRLDHGHDQALCRSRRASDL